MKISYHQYELTPIIKLNLFAKKQTREGCLLKIDWENGHVGFADLHPWPELGDVPLDQQISGLRNGKISNQIEQSIYLAKRDAIARKIGVSLFDQALRVKNNYLIADYSEVKMTDLDQVYARGFNTLKVKVGRDIGEDIKFVSKILSSGSFLVRLDYNNLSNWQYFERMMSAFTQAQRSRIEYVEDPFPYNEIAYQEARKFCQLAVDREYSKVVFAEGKKVPVDFIVLKPAIQDVEEVVSIALKHRIPIAVTSYMDHSLGVAHAICLASELKKKNDWLIVQCGCLTTRFYGTDPFSQQISIQGPYIQSISGTGIGFDSLLKNLPWSEVRMK
ncbi:MAG: enolase C-terminal domain-like protein [Pseudobdellovibrionaceae bacterium]